MKIILLSVNKYKEPYPVYPLSLDYVAGAISSKHDVLILDNNLYKEHEKLLKDIENYNPDMIGFSIRNIDNTSINDSQGFIEYYKEVIKSIKNISSAPIVLGGSGFTIFPNELLEILQGDYGIIGEGERFNLFLDAYEKNIKSVEEIPGVILPGIRKDIPKPWDSEINRSLKQYAHQDFYLKRGGMLNLQSKRGCNLKCIYCTYPHIEGSELRLYSPDSIAQTAKEIEKAGAKYFFITDSAFNCHNEHSLEVAKAFIKHKVSIPWGAFFIPKVPPENYYKILADSGLKHIEFGTESMSNTMLKSYRKPFNVDNVYIAHNEAVKSGVHVAHYMLLGGPNETEQTINETVENLKNLDKTVIFFFCGIRIYPGTELYNISLNEGQINKSTDLLQPVFYQSKEISGDEIIKIVQSHAKDKENWIVGSGGKKTKRVTSKLYRRGYSGPLWELLIK